MANGAPKPDEFDVATKVMESGLLRVLTEESSEVALQLDVTVEPPAAEKVASAPPAMGTGTVQPEVAPELPARGSRVFIVAGIVAAAVLAFDASLFVAHQNRATRSAAAPAAPDPMPRYMLVPLGTPSPAVAPSPVTTPVVAAAIPDARPIATRERRRSHHRHAGH